MKSMIKLLYLFCIVGLLASCSDDDDQSVSPVVYPIFSQSSGTFSNAFSVEITSNLEGANIYYTTDGSIPTSSSTAYSGPIEISDDLELKAIAIEPGSGESLVGGVSYSLKTDSPDLSVPAGNIEFSQYVKLNSDTEGAMIYYTLDGSDPTTESMLFDPAKDSIWVGANFDELKAIAYKNNFANSDTLKADYSIQVESLSSIYWYAADDAVPTGTSTPFLPIDPIVNNYEVTLNSENAIDALPNGIDVMVLADTYSADFSLVDFAGKVIVTYDNSVEALLDDMLEGSASADDYWMQILLPSSLTWITPEDWEAEEGPFTGTVIISDEIANSSDVTFLKREDIIQGKTGGSATDDAVIVYEVTKGDKQWYWVHIGPYGSSTPQKASQILDYILGALIGE